MPREHWDDVPGDVAASDAQNLPGGFGADNPDNDIDNTIDELIGNDVIGVDGSVFAVQDQQGGGNTSGTGYAEGVNTGSTVDPADLVTTGEETDDMGTGGTDDDTYTTQQREMLSVETEGPISGQRATGTRHPRGKKAA